VSIILPCRGFDHPNTCRTISMRKSFKSCFIISSLSSALSTAGKFVLSRASTHRVRIRVLDKTNLAATQGAEEREENQARKRTRSAAMSLCRLTSKINSLYMVFRTRERACNRACREGTIASTIGGTITSSVFESFLSWKREKKGFGFVVVEAVGDVGNPEGFPSPVGNPKGYPSGRHLHSLLCIACMEEEEAGIRKRTKKTG
jgi:hypothetical protein